ncbi:unnamed protein product, partial [Adineta ricciae]
MTISFVILFRQVKSNYFTILRTIGRSSQLNIELEMRRFNERKQFTETLDLFDKYHNSKLLTDRIIVQVLKACAQLSSLERGQNIHKKLSTQFRNDIYIQTSLIHLYMQCGRVNDAQCVFDSSIKKDVVHYRTMMKGFIRNNMPAKAIETFKSVNNNSDKVLLSLLFNSCAQVRTAEALDFGKQVWFSMSEIHRKDEHTAVSAFDMFIKCGDIFNAEQVFDRIKRIVVNYGQMMKYYNDHRMPMKTINLYDKMKNENIAANP